MLGTGAWGTALALVLATHCERVYLWGRDPAKVEAIRATRTNAKNLAGIPLPPAIIPISDLRLVPAAVASAVIATPYQTLRHVLGLVKAEAPGIKAVACANKGIELGSHLLAHQICAECLGPDTDIGIISGPNFAREVAEGRPAAITVAANHSRYGRELVTRLHTEKFRPYASDDLVGVAVGGAVKNVLAIAAGISDGLNLGANSRAALITRGLAEISRLGTALGGRKETFMGLSGLGDLVLTCTDDTSRNRRFGIALGRGTTLTEAVVAIGLVEGIATAEAVVALADRFGVNMPISTQVTLALRGVTSPLQAVAALLARDPVTEH